MIGQVENQDDTVLLPKSIRGSKAIATIDRPPEIGGLDVYAMRVRGNCMAPDVCDGDHIFISPTADLLPGMVAAIFTRDGKCGVKRLVTVPPAKPWELRPESTIEIVLLVNQESPPHGYGLPMGMIEAVHGAIGIVRDGVFSLLKPTLARPTEDRGFSSDRSEARYLSAAVSASRT